MLITLIMLLVGGLLLYGAVFVIGAPIMSAHLSRRERALPPPETLFEAGERVVTARYGPGNYQRANLVAAALGAGYTVADDAANGPVGALTFTRG